MSLVIIIIKLVTFSIRVNTSANNYREGLKSIRYRRVDSGTI